MGKSAMLFVCAPLSFERHNNFGHVSVSLQHESITSFQYKSLVLLRRWWSVGDVWARRSTTTGASGCARSTRCRRWCTRADATAASASSAARSTTCTSLTAPNGVPPPCNPTVEVLQQLTHMWVRVIMHGCQGCSQQLTCPSEPTAQIIYLSRRHRGK